MPACPWLPRLSRFGIPVLVYRKKKKRKKEEEQEEEKDEEEGVD